MIYLRSFVGRTEVATLLERLDCRAAPKTAVPSDRILTADRVYRPSLMSEYAGCICRSTGRTDPSISTGRRSRTGWGMRHLRPLHERPLAKLRARSRQADETTGTVLLAPGRGRTKTNLL